jgi:hypothetical protein
MAKTHRIVFSFDERSMGALQQMKERGRFSSLGEALRLSLSVTRALQSQEAQGFTEVVVRNPRTDEERVMVMPSLQLVKGQEPQPLVPPPDFMQDFSAER